MQPESKRTFPYTTILKGKQVSLRLMEPEDAGELQSFAQSLPEQDLAFLSIDITRPEAVEQWATAIQKGRLKTVFAEADGRLVGHGSLSHNALQWTRHMGEILLLISPEYRGIGLGTLLANEVYALARELGLQKVVARMASDQKGARQVLERLGFSAEALLLDFVMDREGRTHDLIVMSYDVTGLNE